MESITNKINKIKNMLVNSVDNRTTIYIIVINQLNINNFKIYLKVEDV